MKKIILGLILLFFLGCTASEPLETGKTVTYNDGQITRITENTYFVKDTITLKNYHFANSLSTEKMGIIGMKSFSFQVKHYQSGETVMVFGESRNLALEDRIKFIIRGVLISDGVTATEINIKNLSNIDKAYYPYQQLTDKQKENLYKIFSSNQPIILRTITNLGVYDVKHNDQYRKGITEILEMSIKK